MYFCNNSSGSFKFSNNDSEEWSDEYGDEYTDYEYLFEERAQQSTKQSNFNKSITEQKGRTDDLYEDLRAPIICVLGHVDSGKTLILDELRKTNIQAGEVGGITQQMKATYFPHHVLAEQCQKIHHNFKLRLPGILIIDTPGHTLFQKMRQRAFKCCDIAVIVIDINYGLRKQTIESLEMVRMLRDKACPVVVALNKIDRLNGWVTFKGKTAIDSFSLQSKDVQLEFKERLKTLNCELRESGFDFNPYWSIHDWKKFDPIVPTSAKTGEGIADFLYSIVMIGQEVICPLLLQNDHFKCTILEVSKVKGLGTTIDVILASGKFYENQRILLFGSAGPIVTNIRALLTPHSMKVLQAKGEFTHHNDIRATMAIKIAANGLKDAIAGTSVYDLDKLDDSELNYLIRQAARSQACREKNRIGVFIKTSTWGSLEALLDSLEDNLVPVLHTGIGDVTKADVMRAAVMLEKNENHFACILAFEVSVTPEAVIEARKLAVRIVMADHMYNLIKEYLQLVKN